MPNYLLITVVVVAANADEGSLLQRLDPERRAKVMMALLGLVLIGLLLVAVAWVGARFVLRVARQRPPHRQRGRSDWDQKQPAEIDAALSEEGDQSPEEND